MTKKIVRLTESDLEKIVRRVIKESMGVGFMSGEPNGLKIKKMETKEQSVGVPAQDSKEKYKNLIAKVDQFLPFDIKQLQDVSNKIKAGANLNDVSQPFLKVQKLLEKLNPEGYAQAIESRWTNYKSNTTAQKAGGNDKAAYVYAINDLINMKGALRNKAAQLSGLQGTIPQWAQSELGKQLLDTLVSMSGIATA
jgi:hypothetical protein